MFVGIIECTWVLFHYAICSYQTWHSVEKRGVQKYDWMTTIASFRVR